MMIDSHCHLDVAEFDADRDAVLARSLALGVEALVLPGVVARDWDRLLDFAAAHPGLYAAIGLHPVYLEEHRAEHLERLEALLTARPEIVAVGEIGLDYFVAELDRGRQQALLEAQLDIAARARRPVLLHVRKAHDDVLALLRRHRVAGGIAHAFNGSLQQAERYIELGFALGFGGAVTYERANNLRRLVRELPLEHIVLETDAPDMAPVAHRGQRNSPEYLPEILKVVAELRGDSAAVVAQATSANVRRILPALGR